MSAKATLSARRVAKSQVSFRDIVRGLRELGLNKNSRAVVHSSLSSFGQVVGGAVTVVGALTEVCGTVIMPTFTYQTLITPRVGPPKNGMTYTEDDLATAEMWSPDLPADPSIGAIPNAMLRHPDHQRSNHPTLSFASIGAEAKAILDMQTLAEPYAPLEWLSENDGDVLLVGVDHTANSTIHVGERRAGRRQFVRWALTPERVVEFAWPGDSSGFQELAPIVRPFTIMGTIGDARIQRIPARELLGAVETALRRNPNALLCDNPSCERCADARV